MIMLLAGLVVFLGMHSASVFFPERRNEVIEQRGKPRWMLLYTLVSLIGIVAIVWGYGQARLDPIIIYQLPGWINHLTALLMLPAIILLVAAPKPGRIAQTVKHPQLLAVKIWATAHLLANGDLASILLFGSFLAWAVVLRISIKRRVKQGLAHNSPGGPVKNDILAIVIGIGLYLLFLFWAHAFLFGVAPIAA